MKLVLCGVVKCQLNNLDLRKSIVIYLQIFNLFLLTKQTKLLMIRNTISFLLFLLLNLSLMGQVTLDKVTKDLSRGQGYWNEARIKEYINSSKIDTNAFSSSYEKGLFLLSLNKADEALKNFRKAISDYDKMVSANSTSRWGDNNYMLHFFMGAAHALLNESDSALYYLHKACKENPSFDMGWNEIGVVYMGMNQQDSALQYLERAYDLNKSSVEALSNLSSVHLFRGNPNMARKYAEKAIELDSDNLLARYMLALNYYTQRKSKKAIGILDQCIEIDSSFIPAISARAYYYVRYKENDKAIKSYQKILEIDSVNYKLNYVIAILHYNQNQLDEGIRFYKKYIQEYNKSKVNNKIQFYEPREYEYIINMLNSDSISDSDLETGFKFISAGFNDEYYAFSRKMEKDSLEGTSVFQKRLYLYSLYKTDMVSRGIPVIDSILKKDPTIVSLFLLKGRYLYLEGEYQKSIQSYYPVSMIEPDNPLIYVCIGANLVKQKKYKTASEYFMKAMELYPDYSAAYNDRGIMFLDMKKYIYAKSDFIYAIQADRDNKYPYANLGHVFYKTGYPDSALMYYDYAHRLDHKYTYPYQLASELYGSLKKYNKALLNLNTMLEYNNTWWGVKRRARLYNEMGSYNGAIEDMSECIKIFKDDAESFVIRGDALKLKGKLDIAEEDYLKALEYDSVNVEANLGLGELHFEKGDRELANQYFETAMVLDSDKPFLLYRKGHNQMLMGNFQEARDALQQLKVENLVHIKGLEDLCWVNLNLNEYDSCIINADLLLRFNENNLHGKFMKGLALLGNEDISAAKEIFQDIYANNKIVQQKIPSEYLRGFVLMHSKGIKQKEIKAILSVIFKMQKSRIDYL